MKTDKKSDLLQLPLLWDGLFQIAYQKPEKTG